MKRASQKLCLGVAISLAAAFVQGAVTLKTGADGWTDVISEGRTVVRLGGLDKAGEQAYVRYEVNGSIVRGFCTVTNATPGFKPSLCMLRRRHVRQQKPTGSHTVGRWVRPFPGAHPVEEALGRIISYGEGATKVRYVHPKGQRVNEAWRDASRQHLPLAARGEGVYGAEFAVVIGDEDDDAALGAMMAGESLAVSVSTDKVYNWIPANEPLAFTARAFNATRDPMDLSLTWSVRDWDGEVVSKGERTSRVPPGKAMTHRVDFSPKASRGLYFVEVSVKGTDGSSAFTRTNLARLPDFAFKGDPATSIFGLAAYWPIPDEASVQRLMDRMGVRYLRQGDTRRQHPPRVAFHHSNPKLGKLTGDARTEWIRRELKACVENRNPCWECGNENNMATGGIALKGGGIGKAIMAEPYADFVKEVRRIMREEGYEGKVKLLSLGVAGFDRKFFTRMRDCGAWEQLDGFCLHPGRGNFTPDYPFLHPETNDSLKTEDADHADRLDHSSFWNFFGAVRDCKRMIGDRPLYLTEVYTPTPPNSWWEDGLRDSADNTILTYALALSAGVKVAFYYQLFDTVWFDKLGINPNNREFFFGLMNRDLSFKPAMMAYMAAAEVLDGASFDGWMKMPNDTSHGIRFKTERGPVVCLWDRSEGHVLTKRPPRGTRYATPEAWTPHWRQKVEVTLPASGRVISVDAIGRRHEHAVKDGMVTLSLTGSPLFVYGINPRE